VKGIAFNSSEYSVMSQPNSSRAIVYLVVLVLTAIVFLLRGVGLLTFLPGFVLWVLLGLALILTIVNGLIETR
jgi:hypothetical protein